jgi:hypothetical protein
MSSIRITRPEDNHALGAKPSPKGRGTGGNRLRLFERLCAR